MMHKFSDRFRTARAEEFPWTKDAVYLNNASVGPLPERTRRLTEQFARHNGGNDR